MPNSRGICVAAFIAATALAGCKPDAAIRQGQLIDRGTKAPAPPVQPSANASSEASPMVAQDTGDISGTILFGGKAPAKTIDTGMDPACSLGAASPSLPTEQYMVKNGKLANVFLYIKSGPPAAMQSSAATQQSVVLDQQHCQYVPHVLALQAGGYVQFRNSDPTMHNVHTEPTNAGNETIDISMGPRGAAQTRQFLKPELMIPVRCNNHPWMNAFINVSATPFFTISDSSGHFVLRGLPPGNYTLGAVHEKLGEKDIQVTVAPRTSAKADFSFAL